jgi:hypothetical protein
MKYKSTFIIVALLFAFTNHLKASEWERSYKKLIGKIDQYQISMFLTVTNQTEQDGTLRSSIKGIYYYDRIGEPIEVYGQIVNGEFSLTEYANSPKDEHTIAFRAKGNNYTGTWIHAQTKKRLLLSLAEVTNENLSLSFEHYLAEDCANKQKNMERLKNDPSYKDSITFTDTICCVHELSALKILGTTKEVKALNQVILNRLTQMDTFQIALASKYKTFAEYGATIESGDEISFYDQTEDISMFYSDKQKLIVKFYFTSYAGGAHPNSYESFLNFDKQTGKIQLLENAINTKQNQKLVKDLIKKKLEQQGLWTSTWFAEEEGSMAVTIPDAYALLPSGILFQYNPYEAAPYAAGPIQIFLKYSEMGMVAKTK